MTAGGRLRRRAGPAGDRAAVPAACPPFARLAALRPGDRVAVVAPAGPVEPGALEAGLAVLAGRYRPAYGEALFARSRYLAGGDGRRLAELEAALADDSIRAVFAARGGYGSMRLLAGLPPGPGGARSASGAPRAPAPPPWARGPAKPVVGFSDVTALHLWLQAAGWMSVHGPVVTQLGHQPRAVADRLWTLLESAVPALPIAGTPVVGGVAEGPLIGGNLSLLTRLLGTPYLPALEGAVLLLEDVGERPYRLDRMWTHLALAGVFDRVAGLALGDFTDCEEPGAEFGSAAVLADLAARAGRPCLAGLPIGHGAVNVPVPLGARVRLDATAGVLEFLEPAAASGSRSGA